MFYRTLSKYQTASEKILAFIKDMFSFSVNVIEFNTVYVLCIRQLSGKYGQKKNICYREEDRSFYDFIEKIVKEG